MKKIFKSPKKCKNIFNNICFWLFIISTILLFLAILFCIYLFKINAIHLIDFRNLIFDDNNKFSPNLFWTSLSALGTLLGTIAAIIIGIYTLKLNNKLHEIENTQLRLYTEPHVMLNSISISRVDFETSIDNSKIKGIAKFPYPYYSELKSPPNLASSVLIVLDVVNTSFAFARLRFDSAKFTDNNQICLAEYNLSTIGTHINHIMLPTNNFDSSAKLGLIIDSKNINLLAGSKLTLSYFLDNNFGDHFKEVQHQYITDITDDIVSFYPCDFKNNEFIILNK